jgi:predicted GNAT family acetyltransferase
MATEIINNEAQTRYEVVQNGDLAGFAEYKLDGDQVVFTHTEVDPAFEGQGLGSALAKGALDDVRATGRTTVPRCPFIRRYIDRHPVYQDLLSRSR